MLQANSVQTRVDFSCEVCSGEGLVASIACLGAGVHGHRQALDCLGCRNASAVTCLPRVWRQRLVCLGWVGLPAETGLPRCEDATQGFSVCGFVGRGLDSRRITFDKSEVGDLRQR